MLTAQIHALDVRRRLFRPPGGRVSSDLDIVSDTEHRRKLAEASQAATMLKAKRESVARQRRREALVDGFIQAHQRTSFAFLPQVKGPPRIETIVAAVCTYYRIGRENVLSFQRTPDLVKPRHVIMYLAGQLTTRTRGEIGKAMGDRDHTTVLHGHRKIARLLAAGDEKLAAEIAEIRKLLGVGEVRAGAG